MTVTLNQPAIDRLLHSPGGPVGQDLARRAMNVENEARTVIGGMFNIRTGNLLRSVKSEVRTGVNGLEATVYCDPDVAPYAGFLEHGTHGHEINPRGAGYLLRSEPDNPTPLRTPQPSVYHPGNRPFGFLQEALAAFQP